MSVTDSIEIEIENQGRVKSGKKIRGSWICNDCMIKRAGEEKLSATSTIHEDDNNSMQHEHLGLANKSDVSPNTPTADEANLKPDPS
ncbi:MAG: hypothetical protein ACRD8Z_07985 [Nitrososphaeraceae archaeon]